MPCCASTPVLTDADFDAQMDRKAWPLLKEKLTKVFKSKTREDWCKIMEGSDICFAPILTMAEAPKHPHMAARERLRRASRRNATSPGAALLAYAVGDQGHGDSGYWRTDEGMERRPVIPPVMAGLVPAIHALSHSPSKDVEPGTRPGVTWIDHRYSVLERSGCQSA